MNRSSALSTGLFIDPGPPAAVAVGGTILGLSVTAFAAGSGASAKTCWRTTATAASFAEAVRENEGVVPVNVSTWVLPSGVMVGR